MLAKRPFKTRDDVEVTFEVLRPGVEKAEWVSETTNWEPIEMKRRGKGTFRLKVRLPKDQEIQFRYRFDGLDWDNDEAADAYWPTDRGVDNSVVSTSV
jgi:1,4-alpha-glucan branching enzyme